MEQATEQRAAGDWLLGLEVVFLSMPVTLLDLFALFYLSHPNPHPDRMGMLIGTLLATACLVGFWRMVFSFLILGDQALRAVPGWAWVATWTGCGMCVATVVVAQIFSRFSAFTFVGVFGFPLLIPLAHMWLIAWRLRRGNQPNPRSSAQV
jgi:hypothetical protein